jgi:glutathione peroxidase
MKTVLSFFMMLLIFISTAFSQNQKGTKVNDNILSIKVKDIDGKEVNLSDYKEKVLLIVNVASYCGYTKQYFGLQELYENYKGKGFEILAFPCNQFGNQEPGSNDEIKNFCSSKYNVTFRLFDKIDVNGNNKSPLYSVLTDNPVTGKGDIKWNFEKFIVGKNGKIVARFPSSVEPTSEKIISLIESELKK